MTTTTRSEPGNRIRTRCSCGNEFSVPPSKRGTYVHCLECHEETLALNPEERARIEERRNPAVERHVLGLALWVAVFGLLLGMAGMAFLIEKTPPELVPTLGLGPVPEGLGMMLVGAGLIYLSMCLQRFTPWSGTSMLFGAIVLGVLVPIGFFFGVLPLHAVLIGLLSVLLLAILVLSPQEHRELFSPAYREILGTFRQSVFSSFRSYVVWVPLLIAAGAHYVLHHVL